MVMRFVTTPTILFLEETMRVVVRIMKSVSRESGQTWTDNVQLYKNGPQLWKPCHYQITGLSEESLQMLSGVYTQMLRNILDLHIEVGIGSINFTIKEKD